MSATNTQTFPSRIDGWLIAVTLIAVGLVLYSALTAYPVSKGGALASLGVLVVILALIPLFSYPCEYTLTDTHLQIRSGVVRYQIAYRDITGAELSNSLWAAPALSLKRVKIQFAGRFQLVSPRDRERFIDLLLQRVRDVQGGASRVQSTRAHE